MPKIRKKAKLKKIDGSYPEKSGVLSKNIKKIIQDEDSLQGRIPSEFLFCSNELIKNTEITRYYDEWDDGDRLLKSTSLPVFKKDSNTKYNIFFNDLKTINFNQQKVNYALGVSSSFVNKTNIFSIGNHFLTSSNFETDSIIRKNNIDQLKINQELYTENYRFFDENLKTQREKNEIIIDLPFKDDLILSNLRGALSHSFMSGETFYGHNTSDIIKNSCYYNFNSKGWDYKGNDRLSFDTDHNFVVNFTPPTVPHFLNSSSSIGLPVQNTGFPFAGQNRGGDQNLIKLSDYITDNFILDKIEVEFTLTSRIEEVTGDPNWIGSSNVDLAKCLTFYILNETPSNVNWGRLSDERDIRHDLIKTDFSSTNSNISFSGIFSSKEPEFYWQNPEIQFFKANPNIHTITELSSSDYNSSGYTDEFFVWKKQFKYSSIPHNGNLGGRSASRTEIGEKYFRKFDDTTRDLVTYASFLAYVNNTGTSSNINWSDASAEIDLVYENKFPGVPAEIRFTSSSFKIESNCKSTLSYENGGAVLTRDNSSSEDRTIFLSNKFGGRSGLGTLTGREEVGIYPKAKILNVNSLFKTGSIDLKFNNIQSGSIDSPYILKPSDRLIFGIHSFSNISEFPAVFKLHDKVRFRLIGRYENEDNSNITLSNKRGMTSNSVRTKIIGNTTVINQYDTDPIHFMSGSYLDNRFIGDIKSSDGRVINGSLSSGKEGSFTRSVSLGTTTNIVYDSLMPDFLQMWKNNNKFPYSLRILNSGDPDVNVFESSTDIPYTTEEQEITGSFFNNPSHTFSFPFDEENKDITRLKSANYVTLADNLSLSQTLITTSGYGVIDNNTANGFFMAKHIFPFKKELGLFEYVEGISGSLMTDNNSFSSVLSTERNFLNHMFGSFTKRKLKSPKITYKVTKKSGSFLFDGEQPGPSTFRFHPNITYIFDVSDASMEDTKFSFSTGMNGTVSLWELGLVRHGEPGLDEDAYVSLNLNYRRAKGISTSAEKKLYYFDYDDRTVDGSIPITFYPHVISGTTSNTFSGTPSKEFLHNRYLSGFKYGVYNGNPTYITTHYNWRSYGQFSDKYHASINTAFFNFDQNVVYPVRKTFVDSSLNDIEASSSVYTYNKDDHSRSGRPFFE